MISLSPIWRFRRDDLEVFAATCNPSYTKWVYRRLASAINELRRAA
jgi:hypothetical protein